MLNFDVTMYLNLFKKINKYPNNARYFVSIIIKHYILKIEI